MITSRCYSYSGSKLKYYSYKSRSNCVINLTPDKEAVLAQVYNLLRKGGEMYFADVYAGRFNLLLGAICKPCLVRRALPGSKVWMFYRSLPNFESLILVQIDELKKIFAKTKFYGESVSVELCTGTTSFALQRKLVCYVLISFVSEIDIQIYSYIGKMKHE